uniref:Uncharacterized protein n=1 Tax=Rhizophora mucronata TaxID=61149 RepID=A0A2P2PIQ9_RHIMU
MLLFGTLVSGVLNSSCLVCQIA